MCFPKTINGEYSTNIYKIQPFEGGFMANFENIGKALSEYTSHGAFIVAGDKPEIMTASWGFIGEMWGKRVFIAPVRDSRRTKTAIDECGEFTVCIPYGDKYKKELSYCGTKSGRDCDKAKDLNLRLEKAESVNAFVICGCDKYFECRVLEVEKIGQGGENAFLKKQYGNTPDYHNLYFAEIIKEY